MGFAFAALNILTVVWYIISGSLRALFSCGTRSKTPNIDSDVCVVTGAGQGLGRQLALQLSKCGATVVLWDIDGGKIRSVAGEIREAGGTAHPYVVDCSKKEDVYRVAKQVSTEVGDVAVLINNAGISPEKAFVNGDLKDEEIEKTYAVNALALYWTVRAFLPWMLDSNYGYIVNVASIAALGGYPYAADYSASKAAVLNFSESLRSELHATGRSGVSVTCVCPLFINTRMVWESRALKKGHTEPTMEPLYVAKRILTAMTDKQFLLALPKTIYLISFFKSPSLPLLSPSPLLLSSLLTIPPPLPSSLFSPASLFSSSLFSPYIPPPPPLPSSLFSSLHPLLLFSLLPILPPSPLFSTPSPLFSPYLSFSPSPLSLPPTPLPQCATSESSGHLSL